MERFPKRIAQKGEQALPAIPMEQILKMDGNALEEIAARAGMTRSKLLEIAAKNVRRSEEMRKVRESKDINNALTTRYMLPVSEGVRADIQEISEEADKLEHQLYLADKPITSKKKEARLERLLTRVYAMEKHDQVYARYEAGEDLAAAVHAVNEEFRNRLDRNVNRPPIWRALRANVWDKTDKEFGSMSLAGGYSSMDGPTGPAEYFSAAQPMSYRKNPRPRRYNDSLDHD